MHRLNDPEFALPAKSPFAPGGSPFRQKGSAFLGDISYFDAKIPGRTAAVLKAVPDEAMRSFLSQSFKSSEWYDAFPSAYMQLAASRVSGLTFEQHRRRVGSFHASALNGLYRTLLRVVSNENIAAWGPRMAALYWDFGKTETRVTGPSEVTSIRSGTPQPILQWLTWALMGFVEETLRIGGAPRAVMTYGDIEPDGQHAGQNLFRIKLKVHW